MGAQDISWFSLVWALCFLIPILWISFKLELALNRAILISVARMALQLGFVGIYLKYLFLWNLPWVNALYVLLMICVACGSILKASQLKFTVFLPAVFFSMLIPFCICLLFFNRVIIGIDNLLDAKYFIPIGGMLLGNCLQSIIIGLSRFYSGIKKEEKVYQYALTLYQSRLLALKPFFKDSVIAAINPILASMATIGLVALPGMMTGQILGGSVPMVAIKYQIAIMLFIFYIQFFGVILSILFSIRSGFDPFDMLKQDIF
ncbi:MAG: ABC transporter permease [Desulfobacteraceae bacterium]|nr:MAG: ABC transporter permease [Desulfobacteraceae bacterium]